jgi:aspartate/methionine/tyrosine aminotransferase
MQTSVFERMSGLAARHGAVNLGQGFPDFGWPDEILDSAARALKEGSNQYAPSRGLPALREAVAAFYGRHQQLGCQRRPCLRDERRDRSLGVRDSRHREPRR